MTGLELINKIVPEHTRTSCSDETIYNGWSEDSKNWRCSRCFLLEVLENPEIEIPKDFTIYLSGY